MKTKGFKRILSAVTLLAFVAQANLFSFAAHADDDETVPSEATADAIENGPMGFVHDANIYEQEIPKLISQATEQLAEHVARTLRGIPPQGFVALPVDPLMYEYERVRGLEEWRQIKQRLGQIAEKQNRIGPRKFILLVSAYGAAATLGATILVYSLDGLTWLRDVSVIGPLTAAIGLAAASSMRASESYDWSKQVEKSFWHQLSKKLEGTSIKVPVLFKHYWLRHSLQKAYAHMRCELYLRP